MKESIYSLTKKLKEVDINIDCLSQMNYIQELEGAYKTRTKIYNKILKLKNERKKK